MAGALLSYKILRFFKEDDEQNQTVIATGLTLAEAQEHCHDPETSSSTCKEAEGLERTRLYGPWFDGYDEEPDEDEEFSMLVVDGEYRRKAMGL